jgi:hypothetical protein
MKNIPFKIRNLKTTIVLLSVFLILYGCEDVLEVDISEDIPILNNPIEGAVINSNVVNFQWDYLNGADNYRIQISNSNNQVLIDSLLETNYFNLQLSPGFYKWKVRGENFAYLSQFSNINNFEVSLSDDISQQIILLNTPSDNIYINNVSNLSLNWFTLTNALTYNIVIDKVLSGTQTILSESGFSLNSYLPNSSLFTDDAEYIWKIKGLNNVSETSFSERSIFIDRVQPNQPNLSLPANEASLTGLTVNFNWTIISDVGNIQSPIHYELYISNTLDFSNILYTFQTSEQLKTHVFGTSGVYYWKVRAVDEAGNYGTYSQIRKFTIN